MIMGLSVRDILILDYFDGKPVHTKAPAYQEKVLGPHANQRIRLLLEEGWIRYTRPQETVNMLPDKALADFLAHYGYSRKVRMPSWCAGWWTTYRRRTMPMRYPNCI